MIKYALILFMVLFIGCGGGSSDSNSSGGENLGLSSHILDALSLDETKMVENSLRNANYDNISNLVKLSSNIVSFNHEKNGVKYYTVLNTKTSEVLTNIKNFQGTSITSVTKDTITYDNKQKVDVKEYTQSSYQPKVSYANPKEIIQEKIGYNKRVDKFVYTPQKGGAIVLISAPGGWTIYKYGLENPNNPVREGAIASSDDDDVVTEIKTYSGGKMSYKYYTKMSTNKQIHEVFYDYFNMKKISGDADYQIENNSQSSISFSDTDVENAAENRGVEFYKGYRKLSNGKYLVLGAD
ncbi:MAG: hypothetical protein GXO30_06455, partial [Epsilonproteobacteria bacterium]|nr:hypothetical protein [Campylobacterota bacterium]